MEAELQNLIDDPRFQAYHREVQKPREFNTFDVLQYADYEIRHSNVLAWLLRPAETHGIGAQFLEWFVDHVNGRFATGDVERIPPTSFEASNVAVWRERDYVDITVRFTKEKCLIAIENKVGPASPEHADQIEGYAEKLRRKHEGHRVKSVLLTTSPDGSVNFTDIAHVSWESVHNAIRSRFEDGKSHSRNVGAFVRQYLDLVERWFRPTGVEGFRKLFDDHHSVLQEMRKTLDENSDNGDLRQIPAKLTVYRDALVRLVEESRQNPKELRQAVADCLKRRGCKLHFTHNATQGVYWLNWSDENLADVARKLGCGDFSLSWGMAFAHHEVRARFYLYQTKPEEQDPLDRLKRFMRATPINRHKPDEYPMVESGYGWYRVYDHGILSRDELSDMSRPEVEHEVIRWLVDFMDSADSERSRIDDYFHCLAFRSDGSEPTRADSLNETDDEP